MKRIITLTTLALLALPALVAADEIHGTISTGQASNSGQAGGTVATTSNSGSVSGQVGGNGSGQLSGTVAQPSSSSGGGGGASSGGGGSIIAIGGTAPASGSGSLTPVQNPYYYYGVNRPLGSAGARTSSGFKTTSVGVSSPSVPNNALTGGATQTPATTSASTTYGLNQPAAAGGSGLGGWWWAIAAAILAVIGLAWWGYGSYGGRSSAGY